MSTAAADTAIRQALIHRNILFTAPEPQLVKWQLNLKPDVTEQQVRDVFNSIDITTVMKEFKYMIHATGQRTVYYTLPRSHGTLSQHVQLLDLAKHRGTGAYYEVRAETACANCWTVGHKKGNCPQKEPTCGQCGVKGHTHQECTARTQVCLMSSCKRKDGHASYRCPHYLNYSRSILSPSSVIGTPPPKAYVTTATADVRRATAATYARIAAGSSTQDPIIIDSSPVNTPNAPVINNPPQTLKAAAPHNKARAPLKRSIHTWTLDCPTHMGNKDLAVAQPADQTRWGQKGWGLFVKHKVKLPKSSLGTGIGRIPHPSSLSLCEYTGTKVLYTDKSELPDSRYLFVNYDRGAPKDRWYKDAQNIESYARYANAPDKSAGEEANCCIRVSLSRAYIHPLRDLEAGEEVLIDYDFKPLPAPIPAIPPTATSSSSVAPPSCAVWAIPNNPNPWSRMGHTLPVASTSMSMSSQSAQPNTQTARATPSGQTVQPLHQQTAQSVPTIVTPATYVASSPVPAPSGEMAQLQAMMAAMMSQMQQTTTNIDKLTRTVEQQRLDINAKDVLITKLSDTVLELKTAIRRLDQRSSQPLQVRDTNITAKHKPSTTQAKSRKDGVSSSAAVKKKQTAKPTPTVMQSTPRKQGSTQQSNLEAGQLPATPKAPHPNTTNNNAHSTPTRQELSEIRQLIRDSPLLTHMVRREAHKLAIRQSSIRDFTLPYSPAPGLKKARTTHTITPASEPTSEWEDGNGPALSSQVVTDNELALSSELSTDDDDMQDENDPSTQLLNTFDDVHEATNSQ